MDQTIIDIKYSELLQWLLDRYLIPKDWPNKLEIIKSKKSQIIDTLFKSESEEMQKLKKTFKIFESTPVETISYNDYGKLYQALTKTNEAKEKTFFGSYKSEFIYNAYILDYLYKKNNLYLAENSKILIQNVSYEIPNCLKIIEDLKEQIEYQKKKSVEKNEEIIKNKTKLGNTLKENNIDLDIDKITNSNQIALFLIERIEKDDLFEKMLSEIEIKIKGNDYVRQGMELYEDFFKMIYENLTVAETNKNKTTTNNNEINIKNEGNKKKKHQKYKKSNNQKKETNEKEKENNNDDNNKKNENASTVFHFETFTPTLKRFYNEGDFLLKNENNNKIENNRQNYINSQVKKYKMNYTDQLDVKEFNFNVVNDNSNTMTSTNENDNNSGDNYQETCLLNYHERNLLIEDINEIIIFIEERLSNMEKDTEINLTLYLTSLKDFNMKYSMETMSKIKNELNKLVECLTEKDFIFLCNIFTDENNIKNITDIFNDVKIKNMKLNNLIQSYNSKNIDLEKEIKENEKKIVELRKNTVAIRKITEVAVTKLLKRKINIMGDEYLFAK